MVPFTTTEKSEHTRHWCFDCSPGRVEISEKEKKQIVRAGKKYCHASQSIREKTGCKGEKVKQPLENFGKKSGHWYSAVCKKCQNEKTWRKTTYKKYKITYKDYYRMLDSQRGECAICEKTGKGRGGKYGTRTKFSVDHKPYIKGKTVRGLLCSECNTTLGNWTDDPYMFLRAFLYLDLYERYYFRKELFEEMANLEEDEIFANRVWDFLRRASWHYGGSIVDRAETFALLIGETSSYKAPDNFAYTEKDREIYPTLLQIESGEQIFWTRRLREYDKDNKPHYMTQKSWFPKDDPPLHRIWKTKWKRAKGKILEKEMKKIRAYWEDRTQN